MSVAELKKTLKTELPKLLKDKEILFYIQTALDTHYAHKKATENSFDKALAEIKQMRLEHEVKWEKNQEEIRQLRLDTQANQVELKKLREEEAIKWAEQNKKWEESKIESAKKWDESKIESDKKWDEQNKKFYANQEAIQNFQSKFDQQITSIGARWGRRNEAAYRNSLKGILSHLRPDIQVNHYEEYDDEGIVFGEPEQVEIDLIIQNGQLILVEIKSHISTADVYLFYKKGIYYAKKHQKKPDNLILVSPWIDENAIEKAQKYNMQMYSYIEDVNI